MLANSLVCVALVALAANTILSASLIFARASIHRLAQTYLNQTYRRALDSLQSSVTLYAQSGALPSPMPTFTPLPRLCVDARDPCAFTSFATISLLRMDAAQTPVPCTTAGACASNEETNVYVSERRIMARISASVIAADGTVLASRDEDVTLRTMNAPPYVAITGAREITFDGIAPGAPGGEDAGRPPATSNPCAFASPGDADDTVVRVAYENAQTGACRDGSAWRTASY